MGLDQNITHHDDTQKQSQSHYIPTNPSETFGDRLHFRLFALLEREQLLPFAVHRIDLGARR